ncbi:hypothetical protein M569_06731, partial [Genlisea aurea]
LVQIHSQVIRRGYEQDHVLIACFISKLLPENLSYVTEVFDAVIDPNIYLWNIILKAHCGRSSLGRCFALFGEMRFELRGIPDKYTFPSLVKACGRAGALREGRMIHGASFRCGAEADVFVGSSLIDFYGKCGEIESARKVFDEMPLRNQVSWTSMMEGYVNSGDMDSALNLFDEMPERNLVTWNAMMKAFVKLGDLKNALRMFDEMPMRDEISYTTLLDGYAKAGDMAAARTFFDRLPRKDLISWSALISGYAQNAMPYGAVKAFVEMQQITETKPDEFIMVSLMSACSQLGSLPLAKWIETYLEDGRFDLKSAHVAAALVDMNAKCGDLRRAAELFEGTARRDLISYCSMMQGLCIHGRGSEAVALFDRMVDEGIEPDGVAFTVALTACAHAELVEDCLRLFDLMIREHSATPSPDHYACLVNVLGKSGKLTAAAYEFVESTPVESNVGAWGSLLGACGLHGDVELGERVARKLFEIEPRNAENYVLLSNIYAEAERWMSVYEVRDKMGEKGVRKVSGFSYV